MYAEFLPSFFLQMTLVKNKLRRQYALTSGKHLSENSYRAAIMQVQKRRGETFVSINQRPC
jgi:hypothetical protein